jgi:hypothetical protein
MQIPHFSSLVLASSLLLCSPAFAAATKPGDHYVTVDQTDERIGPSAKAKSTNTLFKRQKVTVLELEGGWARVSEYYDGTVEGVKGRVARWVAASVLSPQMPAEDKVPGGGSALGQALKDSDNFARHHAAFMKGSQSLIDSGRCKVQDFKDNGGWSKSTNHAGEVYFAYCGGMRRENRFYLDVKSGRTFQ